MCHFNARTIHVLSDFNINSTSFKNCPLRTSTAPQNLRDLAAKVGYGRLLKKKVLFMSTDRQKKKPELERNVHITFWVFLSTQ